MIFVKVMVLEFTW